MPPIPSYVMDTHTNEGRGKGLKKKTVQGTTQFLEGGSKLHNETTLERGDFYKRVYFRMKRIETGERREESSAKCL